AETRSQAVDVCLIAVQSAVGNQGERAGDGARGTAPHGQIGRKLWTTAQARPETGLLRGRSAGEEHDVLQLGRAGRADRPAVDAGRAHAGEESAVEASVARLNGTVTSVAIEFHARTIP